jgi:hypothetical protein
LSLTLGVSSPSSTSSALTLIRNPSSAKPSMLMMEGGEASSPPNYVLILISFPSLSEHKLLFSTYYFPVIIGVEPLVYSSCFPS